MDSHRYCYENTSTYYNLVQKPTPSATWSANNFAITARIAKDKCSTNLTSNQLMCIFWSNSIIIRGIYFKS